MTATALPHLTPEDIADRCGNVQPTKDGYTFRCPGKNHQDSRNSAKASKGKNGGTVICCYAGCTVEEMCDGLGIQVSQLMPPTNGRAVTNGHHTNGKSTKIPATKPTATSTKAASVEELDRMIDGWRKDKPVGRWYYQNADRQVVGAVARWNLPDGKKEIRPFALINGRWKQSGMTEPRPLYGLPEILESTGDVWVAEGEKAVDAIRSTGLVATTSPHGAAAADKADWSPLAGRNVVVWPDRDEPGEKFAAEVAVILLKLNPPANVRFVRPEGLSDGGDAADWCEQRDASESEVLKAELEKLAAEAGGEKQKSSIEIFDIDELIEQFPKLREPVIEGLIREGEVANLISKTKVGKSWTGYGIGLCVATGRSWLNRFNCRQGTVLLIDNELHRETIANRLPSVAAAMSIGRSEFRGKFRVCSLRGQSKSILDLKPIFYGNPERYSLVIVDALYRAFPEGMSENDNAAMAQVYNALDEYASATGAAFIVIHHATKGEQSGKDVSDVGSGAGAQSRAADTHLILRPHEEDGAVVLDAIVRSFEPVEPMVLRWNFPVWLPADELDPADLKQARPKRGGGGDDSRFQLDIKRKRVFEFLSEPKHIESGATKTAIKEEVGFHRGLEEAIQSLIDDGSIEICEVRIKSNGTCHPGWRVRPEQKQFF